VRVLSKENDRSIDGMFVLAILVRALNRISKTRAKTVFGHLKDLIVITFVNLHCHALKI